MNVSEKVLWLHVTDTLPPLTIDVGEKVTTAKVGSFVPYANATVLGGSGDTTLSVYAYSSLLKQTATDGFVPECDGIWNVVYEAKDATGRVARATYEVVVETNDEVTLADKIVLPKYYISGNKYVLPKIYANDFSTRFLEKKLCQVVVDTNGTTKTYNAGEEFIPTAQNNGDTVKVSYKYGETVFETFEVPCILYEVNGRLQIDNYFVKTPALLGEKSGDGYVLTAKESSASESVIFANQIIAEKLDLTLKTVKETGANSFRCIVITLTDALDESNSVQAVFENGEVLQFIVGDKVFKKDYKLTDTAEYELGVTYANKTFAFGNDVVSIERRTDGKAFEGFTSDKVYVQITVENVEKDAKILVTGLNNHKFNTLATDRIQPYIVANAYGGTFSKGMQYVTPIIKFGDVFAPNVAVTMTVKTPSGNPVCDADGNKIESFDATQSYCLRLDEYGQYLVQYEYSEGGEYIFANKKLFTYAVNVEDNSAPTITVTSGYTKTVKVGGVIVLPDITVSDDLSTEDEITVTRSIEYPNGMISILQGNSVYCHYEGTYTVRIYVTDRAGNIATYTYTVTATK